MESSSEILDCLNCKYDHKCCSKFGVTLSKDEVTSNKYKGYTKVTTLTENRKILGYVVVLKKKNDNIKGSPCVFQDENTGLCTIYENRPEVCRKFSCIGRM